MWMNPRAGLGLEWLVQGEARPAGIAQPPGSGESRTLGQRAAPAFFSNHDLNNLPIPSGAADQTLPAPLAALRPRPRCWTDSSGPARAFAPCVRSTLPRNTALSSMASRSARTSPSTALPARNSTRPVATMLPFSLPWISTSPGGKVGQHVGVRSNSQTVLGQSNRALDMPVDDQIFAAPHFAADYHGLAETRRRHFNCHKFPFLPMIESRISVQV